LEASPHFEAGLSAACSHLVAVDEILFLKEMHARQQKTGRKRPVFAPPTIDLNRSELLVRCRGGLVRYVLGGFLDIADSFLAATLGFLDHAFALQAIRADGFADALLGLADGFVGVAFDLVCRATHGNTPLRVVWRGNGRIEDKFLLCLVCDLGFLYCS
jgi:hypothetical protein